MPVPTSTDSQPRSPFTDSRAKPPSTVEYEVVTLQLGDTITPHAFWCKQICLLRRNDRIYCSEVWLNVNRHIDGYTFKLLFLVKEKKQVTKMFISSIVVLHKVSNDISNIYHFVSIQISYPKKWPILSPTIYHYHSVKNKSEDHQPMHRRSLSSTLLVSSRGGHSEIRLMHW